MFKALREKIKELNKKVWIKIFGFEDEKHVQDFMEWDREYRLRRSLERKRGRAQIRYPRNPSRSDQLSRL